MKKHYFIFLTLFVSIYGMEDLSGDKNNKEIRKKFGQALLDSNLPEVKRLCKKSCIDLNKIDFSDTFALLSNPHAGVTVNISGMIVTIGLGGLLPLEYAVLSDNLNLVSLLCSYGADPNRGTTLEQVFDYSRYRSLPILLKYGLDMRVEMSFDKSKMMHHIIHSHKSDDVQKFIAACILLHGPSILEETNAENETPLQYARKNSYVPEAIQIFEDEKLRNDTIEVVSNEFKRFKIEELGLHRFILGRELGMSFGEMKQHKQFIERIRNNNSNLLENKN